MKEQLAHVVITLDIAGRPALFVGLSEDGSIRRMGTGSVSNTERDLYIGDGQSELFASFMEQVPEEIFSACGRYELPARQGADCLLTILFGTKSEPPVGVGFEFLYGAESEGPPDDICRLVRAAVELTGPWFQQFKEMERKAAKDQPDGSPPPASPPVQQPKRRWRDLFRRA